MDLHNGKLLWQMDEDEFEIKRNNIKEHYDVVIIGGGLSGSLCAYTLENRGLKIAIVDKGKMGTGSTLANTGLMHYTNDIMLSDLIKQIGEEKAVRFYQMCQKAINQIETIAERLPFSTDFVRRKTLYYSSDEADARRLRQEYYVLKKYDFNADYWNRNDIENHFPFSKQAAIVTQHDAEMNPFKFTRGILQHLNSSGVDLFENVTVGEIKDFSSGIKLHTSIGTLHAEHLIVATGYEAPPLLTETRGNLNCTYVMATEPIKDLSAWKDRMLIWETRRPYLYLRTTGDGRIIAGGLDEKTPVTPRSTEWIKNRSELLKDEVNKLFPMFELKIAFSWGAVFGGSTDNLPFIGRHPKKNRIYYLLGYGGNGIVYSMLGSIILKDLIFGRRNDDAEIVKLDR